MNILHTFTRRALGKNRIRTLVTIIGIVLSMALLTAVIEGAYSGLVYMRSVTEEDAGNYHAYFPQLDSTAAESVKEQDFVSEVVASWQTVGYEALDAGTDRLPIFVDALQDNAPLIESRIVKGRMPENEHEIILSTRFYNYGEFNTDAYEIGSTVTLSIGTRMNPDGEPLTENDPLWEGEYVTDAKPLTFTVVGVYKSFDPSVAGTGYRALTKGTGTGDHAVFFTVRHPYLFKRVMAEQTVSQNWRPNSSLMRFYGAFGDDTITTMLYGFATVLVGLVMFGSISLIYNAFSISVAERTRQFGVLKSIGATKKQIRASVRYEALVLSAIGIPIGLIVGCAGIGITLFAIRDTFTALMPNATTQMRLALHPVALLIAALIALITVLISAAIPAKRAAKLQPIDAIRQSTDVKAKPREVRTSKLTQKLFGFEGTMGAKNFKRNRKGYRAAVLSLFMSVVLFIGASSFCTYLTDMVKTLAENANYDVFAYVPVYAVKDVTEEMRDFEGVTRAAYFYPESMEADGYLAETALLTDTFKSVPSHTLSSRNEQDYVPVEVLYLEDDLFRTLCKASGIDPEPYFDSENPNGALMNSDITETVHLAGNKVKRYRYDLFKDDALPATVTTKKIQRREGLVWEYHWDDEAGEVRIAYYPEAYWRQVMEGAAETHSYTMDVSRAELVMTEEEATETVTYSFDAFVKSDDFCLPQNYASLIYPFSKLDASTFGSEKQAQLYFAAKNHKAVREALLELIKDSDWRYNAYVGDAAEERENSRMIVGVVNTFAYGFIILISLIAAANVFNTISTSIMLRRREFAMLKSIGMTEKGMRRMLSYECVIYGLRALLFGLPVSIGVTYLIHRIVGEELERSFYIPWHSILIAVSSVFLVVFATMLYARHKLSKDNPIDALKNENL